YMTRADIFYPAVQPLLASAGLFPVHRGPCPVAAVAAATEFARAGRVVVIFPEGTRRKKARDRRTSPRPGAAYVALMAGVPLVPAAIAGTERLREAPWRVAFGPPVEVADLQRLPPRLAARKATERLWHRIEQLQGQLR